ncbi:Uncharacterised protein [Mammaliicoccus fleurettii]|nr:Uncharacterised protein [Mammaliicoccus fleurettii]
MHFFKKIMIAILLFTFLPHAMSIAAEPISPSYTELNK